VPIDPEILKLLTGTESATVERTESVTNTAKFCEAICAFANDLDGTGRPGYLFIGVDTAGRPTGALIDERLLTTLAGIHTDGQILPQPSLSVSKEIVDGRAIGVVRVTPSDLPPVTYRGRVHVRRGPRSGIATKEEERRLSERAVDRVRTWDARACMEASLDDLALELFRLSYLPRAVAEETLRDNHRTVEEQLASLRLFDLKRDRPTNAAVLLFGKDPVGFFPGAYVQFVRYRGADQASEVVEELRVVGDLLGVLGRLKELSNSLAVAHPVRQPDQSDRTVYEYPPRALLEVFMNSAIHRNYEGSTTPTTIFVYSDRLEAQNPGGLFGDLTLEQFPRMTSYRNPVVAEAAKHLGYVNRFGRGIAIVKDEMSRNGSPDPHFEPGQNHMLVTLRRRA
jgi:ATP-dependent DNA helicase RecG